jgi:hypothetical protein
VGDTVFVSATEGGKFDAMENPTHLAGQTEPSKVGTVIATGNRINRGVSSDYFAGASVGTGNATDAGAYTVVKLDCR